jgi:DNA-binding NarL/FixJ family response regulator
MDKQTQPIRVMIVDDHPLFRVGLEKALEYADGITLIGYADDGAVAVERIIDLKPDVVLLDVNLPNLNGMQVARQLQQQQNPAKIIILTAHHDHEQILHAYSSGARAYCAKDVHSETLVKLIHQVAQGFYSVGEALLDARQMEQWLQEQIDAASANGFIDSEGHFVPLSQREMEILEFVTRGMINKEIANKLGISQQTVKNHMTSILKKLNVNDRTQAAVMALRRGWVRLDENTPLATPNLIEEEEE